MTDQSKIINLGSPGRGKRVPWFAWQTGIPLVILFAILGLVQLVWEIMQHGR